MAYASSQDRQLAKRGVQGGDPKRSYNAARTVAEDIRQMLVKLKGHQAPMSPLYAFVGAEAYERAGRRL